MESIKNERRERREAKRTSEYDDSPTQDKEIVPVVIKPTCTVDGRVCDGACRKANSIDGICNCAFRNNS